MQKLSNSWWQLFIVGLLLIVGYKFIDRLPVVLQYLGELIGIVAPFIIGGVLAFFLYRPVEKLTALYQKSKWQFFKKRARGFSITTVYILFLVVFVFVIGFLVDAIYKNIADIIANWDVISSRAIEIFDGVNLPQKYEILDKINAFLSKLLEADVLVKAGNIVGSVASTILTSFTGLIVSIYMIAERESLVAFCKKLLARFVHSKRAIAINHFVGNASQMFYSYFTGLMLDAVIVGALSVLFYGIYNAPYPWLLGIIVAIGNMIPFFGPIVSAVLVTIMSMISLGPIKAIWILVFQIVLGQLDGNFIQPRIIGSSVGISPFWVIFAVVFFGGIFGPWGMLLGVPIVAALRMVILNDEQKI